MNWPFDAGYDDATVSFQNSNIIVEFARGAIERGGIAATVDRVRAAGAAVDRSRDGLPAPGFLRYFDSPNRLSAPVTRIHCSLRVDSAFLHRRILNRGGFRHDQEQA
jgi:hypothetical protein